MVVKAAVVLFVPCLALLWLRSILSARRSGGGDECQDTEEEEDADEEDGKRQSHRGGLLRGTFLGFWARVEGRHRLKQNSGFDVVDDERQKRQRMALISTQQSFSRSLLF